MQETDSARAQAEVVLSDKAMQQVRPNQCNGTGNITFALKIVYYFLAGLCLAEIANIMANANFSISSRIVIAGTMAMAASYMLTILDDAIKGIR